MREAIAGAELRSRSERINSDGKINRRIPNREVFESFVTHDGRALSHTSWAWISPFFLGAANRTSKGRSVMLHTITWRIQDSKFKIPKTYIPTSQGPFRNLRNLKSGIRNLDS